MRAIAQQLEHLLGADQVVPWEHIDPSLQASLHASCAAPPEAIAYPTTVEALATTVDCAAKNGWRIVPLGNGSKLTWGRPATGAELAISTAKLNRLIDHAAGDLTVTAEAGMGFATLQTQLATARQFLAIAPHYAQRATLGGIVATANTGSLRQRYGGIRDMLIGISFVRADGQPAKAGGRVVKNVAGYDLMKLMTGAYGTLGIITQVTFRLYPLPDASETVVLTGTAEAIAALLQQIRQSSLSPVALDLLSSRLVAALGLGSGLGLLAQFQSVPVSVAQQSSQVLEWAQQHGLQGDRLSGEKEGHLWQQFTEQWEQPVTVGAIACKIGVLPSHAVNTLVTFDQTWNDAMSMIHAGSGLGTLRSTAATPAQLLQMRSHCQTHGGFLTLLDAPLDWKQTLDVWGYAGNALPLMQAIKTQFDPQNLLNPGRFLAGL